MGSRVAVLLVVNLHVMPAQPWRLLSLSCFAVQVSWLLLALFQDQPNNNHIQLFRDRCERAALQGSWVRGKICIVHLSGRDQHIRCCCWDKDAGHCFIRLPLCF
jgi:hypothetical protein